MADNLCREFFEAHSEDNELVPKLVATGHGLDWAKLSASAHSPGIVKDDEVLCRHVIHPAFYDEAQDEVKPDLYADVFSRGMSAQRLAYKELADIHKDGEARAGDRTYIGVVAFRSEEVCNLIDSHGVVLRAYDTAYAHDSSHADICQAAGPITKEHRRRVRSNLYLALKGKLKKAG